MTSNRCAVCKILNETCVQGCISAPHFPSNDTSFEDVSRVFGAMNVRKILVDLNTPEQRQIAANCLRYEAEARRRDPISGCHGMILHHKSILNNIEQEIESTKNELEPYVGSDRMPNFFDLPMPEDFLTTSASLDFFVEKIKSLNAVQKNQLMQLPTADAQMIMDKIFWKGEDQKKDEDGNGPGADGASTTACQ
ncbi:Lateral organ boundaries LOB [Arabidopsis thaliana x Arabidopsis arenosa]|uniref:Lateral organ boundaries LOB n=1 Tax=Arabidopsis thaliana x Arabidopsis arenosa TaxID=1240361 RepID=A0A8T2C6X8_9BRAS|nr:Lateral organ boundaries LOB [Arabidopsis thaliana x Arabidopsis arenosa]